MVIDMKIRFSLSLKLILIVLSVSTIIIGSLSYLSFQEQVRFFEESHSNKAIALAQALDASIGSREELKNKEKIQNYIYKFIWLNPDILKISVNLPDQGILKIAISSDFASIGEISSQDNYNSYEEDKMVKIPDETENERTLIVITPLHLSGQLVGTYEMVLSLNSVDNAIAIQTKNFALIVITSFIILIITFMYLLRKIVINPITRLRDIVNEIGKGNLNTKIDIKSKDEIGQLASAFNQMTTDLRKSQEEIKKHTQEMEQKVRERTSELDIKVKELTDTKTAVLNMMEDMDESNKELVQTQRKLEESLSELKVMDMKKDQFISIAAHELKTPLTSIHGFSQLLQNRKVANNFTKRNKYLKIMDHETKRLSKLVGDILDLSRIDLGTVKVGLDKVNVNNMLDNIKLEMDVHIKKKKLGSEYNVEKNLPVIVTDIEKLTEVIVNLINNAVKYTPKGKITVKVFRDEKDIHFMIKDTGIGISKNNQDRIFDRFYQVDSSYTRKSGGTGLGLALCKEFIDMLDGKLWVKSKENKGSEFHFTLPIKSTGSKRYVIGAEKKAIERLNKSKKTEQNFRKMGFKGSINNDSNSNNKKSRDTSK
jgi:signal transduction histidine kinase